MIIIGLRLELRGIPAMRGSQQIENVQATVFDAFPVSITLGFDTKISPPKNHLFRKNFFTFLNAGFRAKPSQSAKPTFFAITGQKYRGDSD